MVPEKKLFSCVDSNAPKKYMGKELFPGEAERVTKHFDNRFGESVGKIDWLEYLHKKKAKRGIVNTDPDKKEAEFSMSGKEILAVYVIHLDHRDKTVDEKIIAWIESKRTWTACKELLEDKARYAHRQVLVELGVCDQQSFLEQAGETDDRAPKARRVSRDSRRLLSPN
jgi:hypothetical protein